MSKERIILEISVPKVTPESNWDGWDLETFELREHLHKLINAYGFDVLKEELSGCEESKGKEDKVEIDWEAWRAQTKSSAKEFIEATEEERLWYIGGEILDSAIIADAWDDNIRKVCDWIIVNGKGLQPSAASHLIDKNT